MARRYARDRLGRFAPKGSGATARGGRLTTASGKRYQRQTMRAASSPSGRFQRGKAKAAATGPRNSIRRTGTLKRKPAASNIRRTNAGKRTALAFKKNAIRSYKPATESGKFYQGQRKIGRIVSEAKKITSSAKTAKPKLQRLKQKMQRMAATDIAWSQSSSRLQRMTAVAALSAPGVYRAGRKAIQRRAERASAAAARGSMAGQKAQGIYDRQLAFTGAGKTAKGKNNYRPGPSNKRGTPRRRRKQL